MFLEQIERKEAKMKKARDEAKSVVDPTTTKTLGVHGCPRALVERLAAVAKARSKGGPRVTVAQVAIEAIERGLGFVELP